jgi:hypothetical protein
MDGPWIVAVDEELMLLATLTTQPVVDRVGRPEPPARPAPTTAPAQAPSADRVRDYQDRLRLLEAQAMKDAQVNAPIPAAPPVQYDDTQRPAPQDPIVADRKRREYESLFASNVVLSRRPENERPDIGRSTAYPSNHGGPPGAQVTTAVRSWLDPGCDSPFWFGMSAIMLRSLRLRAQPSQSENDADISGGTMIRKRPTWVATTQRRTVGRWIAPRAARHLSLESSRSSRSRAGTLRG